MPYIEKDKRNFYDRMLGDAHRCIITAGDLNYCITKLCDNFIGDNFNYEKLNSVIGVLECAKLEYYRRVGVPYEEKKIKQNGDVYKAR